MPDPRVPVVLLPGMNCTRRLWFPVLPALTGRDVIHAEIAGQDLEECLRRLLSSLPPRFALAGLSLGGIVAMALTRAAPERIERLCLLDTNAREPSPVQIAAFEHQLGRLASGLSARAVQEELLDVLLHSRNRARLHDDVLLMGEETGELALAEQYAIQRTRVDERPYLEQIKVPVAVIAGREDALCPPERHEEIAELVPGAELTLLPNTGHLSPLESPREVSVAIAAWLRDWSPLAHANDARAVDEPLATGEPLATDDALSADDPVTAEGEISALGDDRLAGRVSDRPGRGARSSTS